MTDVALTNYVRQSLAQGRSASDVEAFLVKSGWPKAEVHTTVQAYLADQPHCPVLKVEGLCKSFGRKSILESLYIEIEKGEIIGIIGQSGAGKTTLLNLLVGFYEPDKGDVTVLHNKKFFSVFKSRQELKCLVGFSTQKPSIYMKLTCKENLLHFASLYAISRNEAESRTRGLLRVVGLEGNENVLASDLSGGMQKRLDIACALIHDPAVLILDEPTADLDPILRNSMLHLVKEINKHGTTIIMSSHFLGDIEHLCQRIAVLRNKTISEIGTPDDLKRLYSRDFIVHLNLASKNYQQLVALLQQQQLCSGVERQEHSLRVRTPFPEQVIDVINTSVRQSSDKVQFLHVARPSIQEVFAALVKQ